MFSESGVNENQSPAHDNRLAKKCKLETIFSHGHTIPIRARIIYNAQVFNDMMMNTFLVMKRIVIDCWYISLYRSASRIISSWIYI